MEVSLPNKKTNIAILLFVILDLLWFRVSKKLYPNFNNVNIKPAIFAWILLGITIGCGYPETVTHALIYGTFVGLIIYGVFNATEACIREDWRQPKTIISDIIWGITVCSIVSVLSHFTTKLKEEEQTIISIFSFISYVIIFMIFFQKQNV